MTFFFRTVISFFLFLNFSGISAQQSSIRVDNVYGFDPSLYNGRQYTFFPPLNTGGNQYFSGLRFETGSAIIRGKTYKELALNYDIYNQQLILEYKNKLGATSLIIVSDAWLKSFSFKGLNFEIISFQDTLKRIFQVLGEGPNRILYYWEKNLKLDSFQGSKNHIFSQAKKVMNVYSGNQILRYWNNKSFYCLFPSEIKIAVKEYLHKRKINVKKADDNTMSKLIYYCNTLYEK
jgi:hypothetical protein